MFTKKHIIITGIISICIGICLHLYTLFFSFPRTYVSHLNLSGMTRPLVTTLVHDYSKKPIIIVVGKRAYSFTYETLGVVAKEQTIVDNVFEPNNRSFFRRIPDFFQSFGKRRLILPALIFTQNYYRTIENLIDEQGEDDVVVTDVNKQKLLLETRKKRFAIDPEDLKNNIILAFGEPKKTISPALIPQENTEMIQKITDQNVQLARVFTEPVSVVCTDYNVNNAFLITPEEFKQVITFSYDPSTNSVVFLPEPEHLQTLIKEKIQPFVPPDKLIDMKKFEKQLVELAQARFFGSKTGSLIAQIQTIPNTDGSKAPKYIEVDISQQTMYLFEHNTMVATYKISSGLYYPTPVGSFTIINKALNAYSDIYHVYMPYWMGFHYSSKLNAYFGIHELPYWVASGGQKIQRPREFIGSPHTGGCVSLDIGAAREVYDFTDIGMPVYIFD